MNADEIRTKITECFVRFESSLKAYYDYAQQVTALSEEYHKIRLGERAPIEELTLLKTLNANETPKTLDTFLASLGSATIKRIIFDRKNNCYHVYV